MATVSTIHIQYIIYNIYSIYICCLCFWELAVNVLFCPQIMLIQFSMDADSMKYIDINVVKDMMPFKLLFVPQERESLRTFCFRWCHFCGARAGRGFPIHSPYLLPIWENPYRLIEDTSVEMPQEDNGRWQNGQFIGRVSPISRGPIFELPLAEKSLEATRALSNIVGTPADKRGYPHSYRSPFIWNKPPSIFDCGWRLIWQMPHLRTSGCKLSRFDHWFPT